MSRFTELDADLFDAGQVDAEITRYLPWHRELEDIGIEMSCTGSTIMIRFPRLIPMKGFVLKFF